MDECLGETYPYVVEVTCVETGESMRAMSWESFDEAQMHASAAVC